MGADRSERKVAPAVPRVTSLFCSVAAILAIAVTADAGVALAGEPPTGFGNIPFGAKKEQALGLNAGNGRLADNADKSATLSYSTMIAGLSFDVAQNFDPDGKAIDAKLTYQTREHTDACIGRFNYVLNLLNERYGKPRIPPVLRREEASGTRTDNYTVEYAFATGAAIKADAKTSYPTPQPSGAQAAGQTAGAAAPAGAGQAADSSCGIILQYMPPGWTTHF
jgi:hypothetical protein